MAEPDGQSPPRVTANGGTVDELLTAGAERFGLFAALRLIEASRPDRSRFGEGRRARDEPVRLGQPPYLRFPPAQIAQWRPASGRRPARLLTYVIGLFGSQGPLPLHVTRETYMRARSPNRPDTVLADFCDLFHHRLLSFFWRATARARPAVEQDRPASSRFQHRLGALAGLAGPAFFDRSALPDPFVLHTAGLLALQSRPPEVIARLVDLYFGVPVRVQEFAGAWVDIPPPARTRIGAGGRCHQLGVDAVEGRRVYLRHHRFRLILGPLGLEDFRDFLPDGPARPVLNALVRQAVGLEFDWDVQLVLRRDEVPPSALDGKTRLGLTSWSSARHRPRDAGDVVLRGGMLEEARR